MDNPKLPQHPRGLSKSQSLRPIFLVLSVLAVLAVAAWAALKLFQKQPPTEGVEDPNAPVTGRLNPSDFFTEEELKYSTITEEGENPEYQPVLANSPEGLAMIEEKMKLIQTHNNLDYLKFRGQIQLGRSLMNIPSFSKKGNEIIRKAFGRLEGVDPDNPATWPIYGKYETKGKGVYEALKEFAYREDKWIRYYNLSKWRLSAPKDFYWIGGLRLNLMTFTDDPHLVSADRIWWGNNLSQKDREGLDNFKVINNHDKEDRELIRVSNTGGLNHYAAWGAVDFAKAMIAEKERLNNLTWVAARDSLVKEGRLILQPVATAQGAGGTGETKPPSTSTKTGATKRT